MLIGLAPVSEYGLSNSDPFIFFYGLRDLCLIAVIFYYLKRPQNSVSDSTIYFFVYFVFSIYFLEVISQILGFHTQFSSFFNLENYFEAKGVSVNLGGGFFGTRPSLPLYSPGLIAVLFSGFIILRKNFNGKWFLFLMSMFTLSKSVLFFLAVRLVRPFYKTAILAGIISLPMLVFFLEGLIESYPNTLISMHSNSIIEHISPLSYATNSDFTFLPDKIGSSSIYAQVIQGLDSSAAPESLLFSRFLDFNLLSIPIIFLLVLMIFQLKNEGRFIFIFLLALQALTSMANHPIALLPLLFFMKTIEVQLKDMNTSST
tara:strand:+ start:6700 stop:7647 length:948 start_codon:yes stop_codon:yes gene_type:complete